MAKADRTLAVLHRVANLDRKFGRDGPPRSAGSKTSTRIVAGDHRWEAHITREHEIGPDGKPWDLLELFAYGQRRITAVFRDDAANPRLYLPGPWEEIFCLPEGNCLPLHPND